MREVLCRIANTSSRPFRIFKANMWHLIFFQLRQTDGRTNKRTHLFIEKKSNKNAVAFPEARFLGNGYVFTQSGPFR